MSGLTIRLAACLPLSVLLLALQFNCAQSQSSQTDEDLQTKQLLDFIDGKDLELLSLPGTIEIPFVYPRRPTLEMTLCGQRYALLLDSGTRLSILNVLAGSALPSGLSCMPRTDFLADLDDRPAIEFEDHTLSYASAALAACGGLRIRRLPLRIYTYESELPGNDFQGSLSMRALSSRIVEVDNEQQLIRLISPAEFEPDRNALAIPLLQLHGVNLVRVRAGDQPLLLLLDTGFSGELLLNAAVADSLGAALEYGGEPALAYQGFHGSSTGQSARLADIALESESWPGLAQDMLILSGVDVLVQSDFGEATALGRIDGIIGSGLLSRCNYALDQNRSVIFIRER